MKLVIGGFGEGNVLALINDHRTFIDGRLSTVPSKPNVKASALTMMLISP